MIRSFAALSLLLVSTTALAAPARPARDAAAWDVNAPPNATLRQVPLNVSEGTWMNVDVSPDGARVVFDLLGDLYVMPIGGSTAAAPATRLTTGPAFDMQPRFSPDGKRIAFTSDRGGLFNIWVMDADGKNARQMTIEPAAYVGWLPGGDRLATLNKTPDDRRLWAIEVESGRRTPLSDRPIETGLGRLSPDGTMLAVNSRQSGTINVWTLAIDGGEPNQLTFDREMMGFPCWSPDGKWMAIEMKRGSDTHLAVIPSAGLSNGRTDGEKSEVEQLTSEPGQSWPGSWGPDGDRIAFAGQRQGIWNIYWVARGDHRVKRVTGYQKPNTYVRYPAWSPRGDQVIYEYAETRGNVWMMTFK